jgi:putative spermidine/putrescine transport system permease protein
MQWSDHFRYHFEEAFRHVLLPLAMPGLMSGSLLVFMVALGYYITPALVGAPRTR